MERLIQWVVRRYVGGPGRSWVYTTLAIFGFRAVRRTFGRKELIDVGPVGKGDKIIIEQLSVTHKQQLRAEKAARREAKKAKRVARRERRAAKKLPTSAA